MPSPSVNERINLKFIPINEYERGLVYGLYSELLFPFVDAAYGWDNDFQKNYFTKHLTETIFWVEIDNLNKAVVCIVENNTEFHVHLLLVNKKHQDHGCGKAIMKYIHKLAFKVGKSVVLSTFKSNRLACDFYMKLGYEILEESESFLSLQLVQENQR